MISIYNYSNPVDYLKDYFTFMKSTRPDFSLSKWATEAKLSSPNLIIDILKEKKEFKIQFAAQIIESIGLDESHHSYFLALTAKQKSTDPKVNTMYDLLLGELRPTTKKENFSQKHLEDGGLFSHWILTTILGITRLEHIEINAKNIKSILREEISEEIIDAGISYLLENNFLKETNGKFTRVYDQVTTVNDKKHSDVNNYFCQMADMAKKSVNVDLHEREFHSFNMPIDRNKIPLAKEIIRKCRGQLSALCEGSVDNVYQMNMFLFPLTKVEKQRPEL